MEKAALTTVLVEVRPLTTSIAATLTFDPASDWPTASTTPRTMTTTLTGIEILLSALTLWYRSPMTIYLVLVENDAAQIDLTFSVSS